MKKVRVRVKQRKPVLQQQSQPDMLLPGEPMIYNYAEETAMADKAYHDYFAMFPGDDIIVLEDHDEADAFMDGTCDRRGWSLYLWGVENHRHWWEKEDLPDDVIRKPHDYFPYCD